MAKRFDPARLFEVWRYRRNQKTDIYLDDESAFDANASGKKGMSMYSSIVGAVGDRDFRELLALAFDRDLVVTLHRSHVPIFRADQQPLHIFVSRPEELWRVPAFLAQQETAFVGGRWSDASENLRSYLLGYTKAQRKAWVEARREQQPAWTCATVYALLDSQRRKAVESVGRRCLGPNESLAGLTLFDDRHGMLKPRALSLVPRGFTLARVGMRWDEFFDLFGRKAKKRKVHERVVTAKLAPTINGALLSNVQFLTRSGWK